MFWSWLSDTCKSSRDNKCFRLIQLWTLTATDRVSLHAPMRSAVVWLPFPAWMLHSALILWPIWAWNSKLWISPNSKNNKTRLAFPRFSSQFLNHRPNPPRLPLRATTWWLNPLLNLLRMADIPPAGNRSVPDPPSQKNSLWTSPSNKRKRRLHLPFGGLSKDTLIPT